jgi:hypothetical protein
VGMGERKLNQVIDGLSPQVRDALRLGMVAKVSPLARAYLRQMEMEERERWREAMTKCIEEESDGE